MNGLAVYCAVFALLLAMFLMIPWAFKKKKQPVGEKKPFLSGVRLFGVVLLSVALLFEVFVANFQSFHLVFGEYEPTQITLTDENVKISGAATQDPLTSDDKGTKIVLMSRTGFLNTALPRSAEWIRQRSLPNCVHVMTAVSARWGLLRLPTECGP